MKYGYARVSPGGKSESVEAQARQLTKLPSPPGWHGLSARSVTTAFIDTGESRGLRRPQPPDGCVALKEQNESARWFQKTQGIQRFF